MPPLPRCIACGYDVSAADPAGACPECGASVRASLRLPIRRWVDEAWLRRVRRGLTAGCTSLALWTAGLASLTVVMPLMLLLSGRQIPWPGIVVILFTQALWASAFIVGMIACFITGLFRRTTHHDNPLNARRNDVFWIPVVFIGIAIGMAVFALPIAFAIDFMAPALAIMCAGLLFGYPMLAVNRFVATLMMATSLTRAERKSAAMTITTQTRWSLIWCFAAGLSVACVIVIAVSGPRSEGVAMALGALIWLVGGVGYTALVFLLLRRTLVVRARLTRLIGG